MTDQPTQPTYSPPVDHLLTYGDVRGQIDWPDYLALGFTEEHVPELIRMALDPKLNWADADSLEVWAPIHAWRTLGQLRAHAAIEPLLALLHMFEEDNGSDWVSEDLPEVYGMIGAAAIPALTGYLRDESHPEYPRATASNSLVRIAQEHPDFRAECIAAITATLEYFENNDEGLNAFLISDLVDLKAVEALPVIERAFAADAVDLMVQGDWEDVQIEMGVKDHRDTERKPLFPQFFPPLRMSDMPDEVRPPENLYSQPKKTEKKAKRKQAAKSRKINRKKRK
jgi:Protein of unknown function (DUF1186)